MYYRLYVTEVTCKITPSADVFDRTRYSIRDTSMLLCLPLVLQNFGATNLCIYELQLFGPNNCLYDMRTEAHKLQADNEVNCLFTSNCNTNPGYMPRCLIDDSLTPNPAGGCDLPAQQRQIFRRTTFSKLSLPCLPSPLFFLDSPSSTKNASHQLEFLTESLFDSGWPTSTC